jgi:hypothetical protein
MSSYLCTALRNKGSVANKKLTKATKSAKYQKQRFLKKIKKNKKSC